jgi:hypothetical protein
MPVLEGYWQAIRARLSQRIDLLGTVQTPIFGEVVTDIWIQDERAGQKHEPYQQAG